MNLSGIYAKGGAFFQDKAYGKTLNFVETGFIQAHDCAVIDRYPFRQRWVDAQEANTGVSLLGLDLVTAITRELQRLMTMVDAPHPGAVSRDSLIAD